ncbi:hypothetical protein RS84_00216 [Microbacterium hydrocarbonoxydans]|uniref:Uncharacterized protein n=1 Tax=Microbacterium hydrocarbonoxydans TaxID=273678 RepID=A0A0M2HYI4_9MICO|nr:hypothetical protein [Microbacterium hydrocarbonoxydans]KJL49503.1 hypothetical protein RS84_00216 [Microbacterium hydrocarbonoxydans]
MNALPSNSSITIDGITITSNASAILIWEHVIRRAINAGHSKWLRFRDGDGNRGVLIHARSAVSSYISYADAVVDGENFLSDDLPDWNLASWVDEYIDPTDRLWSLIQSIGIDQQIAARKAASERPD